MRHGAEPPGWAGAGHRTAGQALGQAERGGATPLGLPQLERLPRDSVSHPTFAETAPQTRIFFAAATDQKAGRTVSGVSEDLTPTAGLAEPL